MSNILELDIKGLGLTASKLLDQAGLGTSGEAQKIFTQSFMSATDPYVPMHTGALAGSAQRFIEDNAINYVTPYAAYLYFGKLMVDPITLKGAFYDSENNTFWSRPGVPKVMDPEGRNLNFDRSIHPNAGAYWAERSWADNGDKITESIADYITERLRK